MVKFEKRFDFNEICEEITKERLSKKTILKKVNQTEYDVVKDIIENGEEFIAEKWTEIINDKNLSEGISIAVIVSDYSPIDIKVKAYENFEDKNAEYINFLISQNIDKTFFETIIPTVFTSKNKKRTAKTFGYSLNFISTAFEYVCQGNLVSDDCLAVIFNIIDDEEKLKQLFSKISDKTLPVLEGIMKNKNLSNNFKKHAFFETGDNINIICLYDNLYEYIIPEIADEFDNYVDSYIASVKPEHVSDQVLSETFHFASDEKKIEMIKKLNMHVYNASCYYLPSHKINRFCSLIKSFKTSEGLGILIDLITPKEICSVHNERADRVFYYDFPVLSAFVENPNLTSEQALKLWSAYSQDPYICVHYYRAYEYNLISKALPNLKEMKNWKKR